MEVSFVVGLEVVQNVAEDAMAVDVLKVVEFVDIAEEVLAIALDVGKRLADVNTGTDCDDLGGRVRDHSSSSLSFGVVVTLGC